MEIRSVGVVGAGQMGHGIAQVAARCGLPVVLYDVAAESIRRALGAIERSLARDIRDGLMDGKNKRDVLSRIRPGVHLEDLAESDFIVEAAPENEAVKCGIFRDLDRMCSPAAILATNTSSISISLIAAHTSRPESVIGMHFMNPVQRIDLVEVIRGEHTSGETFRTTCSFAQQLGKTPVEAGDSPGFLANRILMPMINEAVFALHEGVGSREAIDATMHLGMKHPIGPLALADLIGLDICLAVLETLYNGFKDPKYLPCPLLRRYVGEGRLGRKSGEGFYRYDEA